MKLEQKKPDRPGLWWCWRDGMDEAIPKEVKWLCVPGPSPLAIPKGFTHFALIEQPGMPEPDKVELSGSLVKWIYHYYFNSDINGAMFEIPDGQLPPDGFFNVPLKITLEKVRP